MTEARTDPSIGAPQKLILLLASMMTVLAGAAIAPSLPSIERAFDGARHAAILVPLVLTIPALFTALSGFGSGWLADRAGYRKLLTGALLLYALAGTSGLYLRDLNWLLAGRMLLGVSAAGISTATIGLISDYFDGRSRESFMGAQAAFMALGGLIFLPSSGWLAEIDWHYPFWLYLIALPLAFAVMPLLRRARGIVETPIAATGAATTPFHVRLQILAIGFVGMVIFYLIPVKLPFLIENELGALPRFSGLAIASASVFSAVSSLLFRLMRVRFSPWTVAAIMFAILAVSYFMLGMARSLTAVFVAMPLIGLGMGLLLPNMNSWMAISTTRANRGRWLGMLTSFFFLGQFVSPILVHPVQMAHGLSGPRGAFAVTAYAAAALGLAYLAMGRFYKWRIRVAAIRAMRVEGLKAVCNAPGTD